VKLSPVLFNDLAAHVFGQLGKEVWVQSFEIIVGWVRRMSLRS
jgi:hypothetical protein